MYRVDLSKKDFLYLAKNAKNGVISLNGAVHKLDRGKQSQMLEHRRISIFDPESIDVKQIEWLSSMRFRIAKSNLPMGLGYYKNVPVSVLYPVLFSGYKNFNQLMDESGALVFDNLRTAYENNIELMENGIYNQDFAFKNILYDHRDVQLIDLDGRHIKDSKIGYVDYVYSYFIRDFYTNMRDRINALEDESHRKEALEALRSIFMQYKVIREKEKPLELINEVEKMRILK